MKLLGASLALVSSIAFGTTLSPITLLNPSGSSSGQAIVSTGSGTAPAWGGIGMNGIAAIAANTVLANATGSSASPTAFSMPSCSGGANALSWVSGTGFTCSTTLAPAASPAFTGTPTAPTAAVGTNSTQIATTAFVAGRPQCYSIMDNGGDNTFTNDNASAWTATLALGPSSNKCIYFPPGKYKFGSGVSYTIPSGVASITILGAGPTSTTLAWPAGGGIAINYAGTTSAAHVQNLALTTGTTATGTALALNQAASVSNSGNSAESDVTNVTIRGDDGYQVTNYWATGINASVSNVNFLNDHFVNPIGNGNQVVLGGTSTQVPVIFNFANCYFEGGNNSLTYGNYVQGVQVSNSNFVSANYGIISNASESGLDQLTVVGSQFANNTADIYFGTAVPNTVVMGNLFYVANSNYGLDLISTDKFSIIGNMFTQDTTGASAIGVNIGATSVRGGSITGNNFNSMGTVAIQLNGGTTSNITSNDNVFNANGANVSNGSSSNTILDYAPVSGGFGFTSLTTNTATNLGSVSLTPGTWFCTSQTNWTSSANNLSVVQTGMSTTSASMPSFASYIGLSSGIIAAGTVLNSTQRVVASSNPTTLYLVSMATFASGTSTSSGQITCNPSR